jgi:hypothetical protein
MAEYDCRHPGPPAPREEFDGPNLVIAEGGADCEFLKRLFARRGITSCKLARPAKGKSDFTPRLELILNFSANLSAIKTVVLVRDCDVNPASAFKEIQDQVRAAGRFGVPTAPLVKASASGVPDLSIVLIPAATTPGCLETLILEAVRAKWPDVYKRAEEFISLGPTAGADVSSRSKALMACVIASVCLADPSCAASRMWDAKKGLLPLLDYTSFDWLADYFAALPP